VSDLIPLAWWEHLDGSADALPSDATLRFATLLVQDGVTGVTLVLPRAPGVLVRARQAAQLAGVSVCAERIGGATITLRFSNKLTSEQRRPAEPGPPLRGSADGISGRWASFQWWVRSRALAILRGPQST
jgi:hypothetical protein